MTQELSVTNFHCKSTSLLTETQCEFNMGWKLAYNAQELREKWGEEESFKSIYWAPKHRI